MGKLDDGPDTAMELDTLAQIVVMDLRAKTGVSWSKFHDLCLPDGQVDSVAEAAAVVVVVDVVERLDDSNQCPSVFAVARQNLVVAGLVVEVVDRCT